MQNDHAGKSDLHFITSEKNMMNTKVFCTFHELNEINAYEVMNDIISVCDCTVFYYKNGKTDKSFDEFKDDLAQMSLFVVIVSADFLSSDSFARDVMYKFAVDHMIPVLPIMIEPGLEQPFNSMMGNLQYLLLENEKYDITAVPYLEKLKNYMSQTICNDKKSKDLRDAFDASIFLSYRKKDRSLAQDLMNKIHSDERCQGISIWYDEFLVPGENFNDNIRQELENSSLVILVVTPHVSEKNNYIVMTEYPAAVSMGKTIIPFEMCHTDRCELDNLYSQLPELIPGYDVSVVRDALIDSAKKLGIVFMETSAEKEFLRGIAYLKGICVEKNTKIGADKIINAAKNGVIQAVRTLILMYKNGDGVSVSLKDAEFWQKIYIETLFDIYAADDSVDNAEELIHGYFDLGEIYEQCLNYTAAIDVYKKIVDICSKEQIKSESRFIDFNESALTKAGSLYMLSGDFINARYKCFERALNIRQQQFKENPSLNQRLKVCVLYTLLAECCEKCNDRIGAKTYAVNLKNEIPSYESFDLATNNSLSMINRFLLCNNKLGHFYIEFFEHKSGDAFLCIGNSVIIAQQLVKISDSYTSRRQLISAYINDGDQHANKNVENHLRVAEQAYLNAYSEVMHTIAKYKNTFELKRIHAQIMKKQAFVKLALGKIAESILLYESAIDLFRLNNIRFDSLSTKKDLYDCLRDASVSYERQGRDIDYIVSLLLESVELAQENIAQSELAVYKKDEAAAHELLVEIYRKQWDMDNAFFHLQKQVNLLRDVAFGTHRLGDIRLFAKILHKGLSIAKLACEFDVHSTWNAELKALIATYEILL